VLQDCLDQDDRCGEALLSVNNKVGLIALVFDDPKIIFPLPVYIFWNIFKCKNTCVVVLLSFKLLDVISEVFELLLRPGVTSLVVWNPEEALGENFRYSK
jgi:hypothetical protein